MDNTMPRVFAFQNDIETILKSASGGAFSAIVDAWVKLNYQQGLNESQLSIYGASYDSDLNVKHIKCTVDNWHSLRGSKYTVSDISNLWMQIDEDAFKQRQILFSGTPCQVAAVKKYIEKKGYDRCKFLLIDIICHGTPEKKVWEDYIKHIEKTYGGKLINYSFRYKVKYSSEPIVYAEFSNGKKVKDSMVLRSFIDLFFTYLPLRKCCYTCKFSNMNRVSDITIGDFWGADEIFDNINIHNGISQIIVNTSVGMQIIDSIKNPKTVLLVECFDKSFLNYQHNLVSPTEKPANVHQFWEYYNSHGYADTIGKFLGSGSIYKIKFCIKRILAYTGLREIIKKHIKKIKGWKR